MSELVRSAQELLGADVRPLSGGYSGETFLVGAAGEEAVLRLYLRDPERAAVDAALLELVRGIVPVPRVLELRERATPEAPAHLLLERLPGVRLEELLAEASPAVREAAGRSVGQVLARLAGMPLRCAGTFAGPDLRVQAWPPDADGLRAWVESHRGVGAFERWTPAEFGALLDVADAGQELLDRNRRICLCHSDFNTKNMLVDATGEVTGLIDWEFAHAGMPYADLGNVLRLETDEAFCVAVVRAFVEYAPPVDPRFVAMARAADLFAIVDLAARRSGFELVERVHEVARATARTGDLAAGRPDWAELAGVTTATSTTRTKPV